MLRSVVKSNLYKLRRFNGLIYTFCFHKMNIHDHLYNKQQVIFSNNFTTLSDKSDIKLTNTDPEVFAEEADRMLNDIQYLLETDQVDNTGLIDDIDYSDGILKIVIPHQGTWVLNSHSFTKQIWVSSPISGPSKYNYHQEENLWLGERYKNSLIQLIEEEMSTTLKLSIQFPTV